MKPSRSRNAIDESLLRQFPFSDGRACRMLRSESHPTLCADHARREQHHLARQQRGHDLQDICSQLAALHAHAIPPSTFNSSWAECSCSSPPTASPLASPPP